MWKPRKLGYTESGAFAAHLIALQGKSQRFLEELAMDRREFLTRTAMVSAVAGAASAAQKSAAAVSPIRCGILGIDHAHAMDVFGVLKKAKDYELAGVCEPDEAVLKAFETDAALKGVLWRSQEKLLGDETVQMIAVESGVPRLLELGQAVIDAGKHLHLDKPAGTSLEAFRKLLDDAERRRCIVQMGYMFRYNPGFDFVRRAVREGWLGDVYSVHASMCTGLGPEKRRRMAFHPGGIMLELGCHLTDMIVLLLGEPLKVTSFLRHDGAAPDGLADNTLAVYEHERAMAVVETSALEKDAFPARRFKVAGTKGTIILSPLEPPAAQFCLGEPVERYKAGWQTVSFPDLDRHVLDFEDLARCIRGEKGFEYPKSHDFIVQRTVLRACGMNV